MTEVLDEDAHCGGMGEAFPVLLGAEDKLSLDEIEHIAETLPAIGHSGKHANAIRRDLRFADEFVQEFTRARYPRDDEGPGSETEGPPLEQENRKNDLSELLFAVVEHHTARVKEMGSLSEKDIPRLREQWKTSCRDIMQGVPECVPPLREINHRIQLVDEKKKYKYRAAHCAQIARVPFAKKVARYTKAGWWRPARSEHTNPMLVIPKKNGDIRTVVNATERNDNTVKDVTPLPDQDLIRLDVARAKIRSKIDFSDAYEQIRVEPDDVWKTAFTTVLGTYESLVMQQGDCNAPSTFQRIMNHIFRDYIGIFMHVYLDDVFVFSKSVEEHEKHLQLVFDKIREHQFFLKEDKCSLYAEKVECLGHIIDEKGLHADSDKMARIREWKTPRNYKEVQRFLGLVQYLAHFLPNISEYTSPLSAMTKNGRPFLWRPLHDKCFQMIKNICCSTPILKPIDPDDPEPIWVICDASVFGIGAMYGQGKDWQTCRPAGFISKKFSDAQRHYRTFEQETIAILEALLKWEDKLMGYRIHVVTDHKALEFFKTQRRLSARQSRWMEYLSRFDFDIRYVKGKLNKVADALSRFYEFDSWDEAPLVHHYVFADERLDPNHEDLPWDRHLELKNRVIEQRSQKAQAKRVDELLHALRERVEERDVLASTMAAAANNESAATADGQLGDNPTVFESRAKGHDLRTHMSEMDPLDGDILKSYAEDRLFSKVLLRPEDHPDFFIRDEFIWRHNRGGEDVLCVPNGKSKNSSLHGRIIEQAHTIVGHFGSQRTADYIRRWYWWPRLQKEVESFCDSCEWCIRSKGEYASPRGKLHSLPIAERPWDSIGMDFIGPFPESEGFNYLWVVICRLSSMVHLIPVNTTTTATELSSIYIREVVRLHGLPASIVCDRDPKFTSKWWRELQRLLGTKLLMSTSFHPQTDGATERVNRSIGQILRAFISPDQKDWVKRLPVVEFAINSSISRTTGMAPFEINYGYMPRMMKELPATSRSPPGVRTFAMDAVRNMAIAHDAIIAERVFQRHDANKRRRGEPTIKKGDLVYLSTKNLSMPKGRASKLVPKFVGPYKVLKSHPETSNYDLELPEALRKRHLHNRFHVGLLRPHNANDDELFPNRSYPDAYDFGAPDATEWWVDEITAHRWKGRTVEFQVKWNLGDSTWESLSTCNELAALDAYLALMGAEEWDKLPKRGAGGTTRRNG